MIVAGIDEAGYGPLLGPLVVGCCAFELPDEAGDALAEACDDGGDGAKRAAQPQKLPCLWKRLRKLVGKSRDKKGRRLHVNDSKLVYSPSLGVKELERSILSIAAATHGWSDDLEGLLSRVAPDVVEELAAYPWYAPIDFPDFAAPHGEGASGAEGSGDDSHEGDNDVEIESIASTGFPLANGAASVQMFSSALRQEMDRTQTRCVHLAAKVVLERRLNKLVAQTRNKASVLLSTSAIHLDHLLRTYGSGSDPQKLVIFCDRQGGREHYGQPLRLMFEEWELTIDFESDGRSEYRLTKNGNEARIIFREKAEAQCLPVAVASMLCKYLREALMGRFNAYWRTHLPELQPTAGYYNDGLRFMDDIAAKRSELGVRDEMIMRVR